MCSDPGMSPPALSSPGPPPVDVAVLFADHHMVNCMLTGKVLRSAGFRSVHLASDSARALDTWKNDVTINIVILDDDLCEVSSVDTGASMLAHIKKYCPMRTPPLLILQTAYLGDQTVAVAEAAGFYCCISKPIDRTQLVETISTGWADRPNGGG